jgi:fucose 4-O-acetylase-like acetyltransferase
MLPDLENSSEAQRPLLLKLDPYQSRAPLSVAPSTATQIGTERRLDLDRAKGLGILLVVLGHLAAKSQPKGDVWFAYLQTALYQFHMPFFMYVSGYVSSLTGAVRTPPSAWTKLLRRRATRLLLPFALFGLAFLVGKMLVAHFMTVDNTPHSFGQGLLGMLWNTDRSPAISVWYIFVIFVLSMIAPPILWATRSAWPLLLVAFAVYLVPLPPVAYMDKFGWFFPFFAMGVLAADARGSWLAAVDRYWAVMLAIMIVTTTVATAYYDYIPDHVKMLVCGAVSMPALHGCVRRSRLSASSMLLTVGTLSFVIYLLNTPFIGLTKGLLLKIMPWDGRNFLIFMPLMMAAGVVGPILVKRFLFQKFAPIDRITS